jgi:hypothetical protein
MEVKGGAFSPLFAISPISQIQIPEPELFAAIY